MDKLAVETLEAARDRIKDPKNWGKENYAKDDLGFSVVPTSPEAVCWCGLGAILCVAPSLRHTNRAAKFLCKTIECDSFAIFNDAPETTHAQVIEKFDQAIELARKEV